MAMAASYAATGSHALLYASFTVLDLEQLRPELSCYYKQILVCFIGDAV